MVKTEQSRKLTIGYVVIIHDIELPRNLWKTGGIISMPSERTAEIKIIPRGTIIRRVTKHLYPLEIENHPQEMSDESIETVEIQT